MNELYRVIAKKNCGVHEATGVLARLWRGIMSDIEMNQDKMHGMLTRWVNDPYNGIPNDNRVKSTERGNLVKELAQPDITWKVFLKGIRVLAPMSVKFEMHFRWSKLSVTVHGFTLKLREIDPELESDDTEVGVDRVEIE